MQSFRRLVQLFTMISNLIKIGTTTWACANFDPDLFEIVFFSGRQKYCEEQGKILSLNQKILNTLVIGHLEWVCDFDVHKERNNIFVFLSQQKMLTMHTFSFSTYFAFLVSYLSHQHYSLDLWWHQSLVNVQLSGLSAISHQVCGQYHWSCMHSTSVIGNLAPG